MDVDSTGGAQASHQLVSTCLGVLVSRASELVFCFVLFVCSLKMCRSRMLSSFVVRSNVGKLRLSCPMLSISSAQVTCFVRGWLPKLAMDDTAGTAAVACDSPCFLEHLSLAAIRIELVQCSGGIIFVFEGKEEDHVAVGIYVFDN
ncbi:hypothetical protein SARC_06630 [Sphaeroforma arctica JP610]|uniref:Uncharacterized protein n=1 Tax=Sphaeroforma arctica JP610 TaxID=667725 RepID=A0A0L0FW29_9EUKA|nr:hypothetical protein SARC_06630 [Sphaeroforma arctica JP610]KNC81037.1 hypothetical protein SARC_06630 [Sphaeroforma arctica JP610]|eukprot:XP_014154939.1 hypothetical protein SARC_06630 [Sphaeroforma arctica JP610]